MFVMTAKVNKTKLAVALVLLIAVIVLAVVIRAAGKDAAEAPALNGETNEQRVTFLAQYGWDVNAEPVQTQTVTVPKQESEGFSRYNDLQRSQGYDLTPYAGKQLTRYVYEVLNYPGASEPVYATIFVLDGRVVGGDVTDTSPGGRMHGFAKPQ